MKKKLPKPRDGWKDLVSKIHRAHSDAIIYHKTMSTILWKLIDVIHKQSSAGYDIPAQVIPLARLVPLTTLGNNIDSFAILQLLETGMNYL